MEYQRCARVTDGTRKYLLTMETDCNFWRGKRVLVTGHTGFMGGWLAVLLKELGARVTGYALAPPTTPSFFEAVGLASLLEADVRADVRDLAAISEAMRIHRSEIVFTSPPAAGTRKRSSTS